MAELVAHPLRYRAGTSQVSGVSPHRAVVVLPTPDDPESNADILNPKLGVQDGKKLTTQREGEKDEREKPSRFLPGLVGKATRYNEALTAFRTVTHDYTALCRRTEHVKMLEPEKLE